MTASSGNLPKENQTKLERCVDADKTGRGRTITNSFRFGLLELLLMTAAIAVWIPAWLAFRIIPCLEADVQIMRKATLDLVVEDPTQLTVRALPSVWRKMDIWKYYAPAESELELRLGTEGISARGLPVDYQAVSLPFGEHLIQLKRTRDGNGFHNFLYIDGEMLLEKHHPKSWLNSESSSTTTDLDNASQTFPLTAIVRLREERASPNHPIRNSGYRVVQLEGDQDHKGVVLWISPSAKEVEAAPHFISRLGRPKEWTIGNRNGVRVRSSTEKHEVGLLDIQPAIDSVLGDSPRYKETRFGVSVRPIVRLGAEAEVPEVQLGGKVGAVATPLTLHMDPDLSKQDPVAMTSRLWSEHAVSDDGTRMRVFAHYQAFPSGAKPVIEILFDSDKPDRIGFLPRAAAGSTPMQACEFVTRFDSRYFWRKVDLEPDELLSNQKVGRRLQSVSLQQLTAQNNGLKKQHASNGAVARIPWLEVPFNRLPLSQSASDTYASRKLSLRTDVSNVTKVEFPNGLVPRWQYQGVPNRQVWWLPATEQNDHTESRIKIEILPTNFFPTTMLALPGGQAIGNVRITVPMPATKPIWLAIEADLKLLNGAVGAQ